MKKKKRTRKIRASPDEKSGKKEEPKEEGRTSRSEKLQKVVEILKIHKAFIITGAVAILIMAVIVLAQMPSKADLAAEISTRTGEMAAMTNQVKKVSDDVDSIKALGSLATDEELAPLLNATATNGLDIEALETRVGTAEGNITALQNLAAVGSPPEAYLSGNLTSGNLTIHAEASEAGDYTANVHLAFSSPLWVDGTNTTIEDTLVITGVNWLNPIVAYNGTAWGVTAVWWNVGPFALTADTEKTITVLFGGLADTPSFAYVEIYPALKG